MRCRRNLYSVSSCMDVQKSSEIFKVIDNFFREHDIPWPKCVAMCTDGARAMYDALNQAQINIDYCYRMVCNVPQTFRDAVTSSNSREWVDAMDEMKALRNNTFTLTTLPEGKKAVGGRWMYTLKTNVDGSDKYKARYVTKKQPTVALSTCKAEYMALATTTQECLYLSQLLKHLDDCLYDVPKIFEDPRIQSADSDVSTKYHFVRSTVNAVKRGFEYIA